MQNKVIDTILSVISRYLISVRDLLPNIDPNSSVLCVLYGIHKGYSVRSVYDQNILFEGADDSLLRDLLKWVENDLNLYYGDNESNTRRYCELLNYLYQDLSNIDHNCFEEAYVTVLTWLFETMSISTSNKGEFYSPKSINKLISYYINISDCNSVYDPFCGTASIVHSLAKRDLIFEGQEVNHKVSILARLNFEARFGVDNGICCNDSILNWNKAHFDAVVSCPPFNESLSMRYKQEMLRMCDYMNDSFEEILFSRAFMFNSADLIVALLPLGFCQSLQHKRLRKYLTDNNYIDTIIFLPEKLLFGTSIPCVLVVCRRYREDSSLIKFVNAQSYYKGDNTKTREFDYDAFVSHYEADANNICSYTSCRDVAAHDYNLNLYIYSQKTIELKEGQRMVTFGELMTGVRKENVSPFGSFNVFPIRNFSQNFIEVLLNKDKLITSSEERSASPRKLVRVIEGKKYLLVTNAVYPSKPKYAIYSGNGDFSVASNIVVYEVNENLVSPEYLVYLLVQNPVLKTGVFPFSNITMLSTAIDSLDNQREMIGKLKQQHAARERAEQEADAKRLGVKTNISDLEHMLGTTYANIDDVLYKLGKIDSKGDALRSLVKELKDNVEYLKRVIKYDNANISAEDFNMKEQDIEAFIQSYCEGWNNYSGRYFRLSLQVDLGKHKMVDFDKALLKVMLDSILTNVERHGFDKRRSETNRVEITLGLEKYEERPYVVVRVANNGAPFRSGFTIDDYITRGRYSANSGRSGLGGYHVYQIVKGHKGFLYLDSNKIWNVIVEILLPINNVKSDNLVEYEHECV